MLRRAGVVALALALAACVDHLTLDDVRDAGLSTDFPKDAAGLGPDAFCAGKQYIPLTFTPKYPQILIALDRSASMQSYFGTDTRQVAAQKALVEAISHYQATIKFGFEQFPGNPSEQQCQSGSCCAGMVSPEPTLLDSPQMESSIQCIDPHGASSCPSSGSDSPSYQALATLREYYKDKAKSPSPSTGAPYILLVTSSEPSCASESHDVCSSALSAASDLGNLGVSIIVLSLGYQPAPGSCLSGLSRTPSGQSDITDSLYTPSSTSELASNLDDLFKTIARASCTMTSTSIPPNTQLTVNIDGESIQQADGSNPNGWSYSNFNNTSITFYGSACDDWVNSQVPPPDIGYYCSSCGGPNACSTLWQYP